MCCNHLGSNTNACFECYSKTDLVVITCDDVGPFTLGVPIVIPATSFRPGRSLWSQIWMDDIDGLPAAGANITVRMLLDSVSQVEYGISFAPPPLKNVFNPAAGIFWWGGIIDGVNNAAFVGLGPSSYGLGGFSGGNVPGEFTIPPAGIGQFVVTDIDPAFSHAISWEVFIDPGSIGEGLVINSRAQLAWFVG